MIKSYKRLILILLLPLTLGGCWDYRDINRKSVVLSIGIDSENNNVKFTNEIANVSGANKGKGREIGVYKIISEGPFFEGSRYDFNLKTNAPDFIGAVRTIVVGKNFAESQGIEGYIHRMAFKPDFRASTLVVICEGDAQNVFDEKINGVISTAYAIENTIKYLNDVGRALYVSALNVQSSIEIGSVGYFLPYITRDKNTIEYLGLAAMKDSKLVGIIKAEDSFGELFILSKKTNMTTVVPHPKDKENMVSLKVYINTRKIKTSFKDGKVNIDIDLKLNSELIYEYMSQQISDDDKKFFEATLSNKVKSDILTALNRSTTIYKCDVFNFARYFRAENAAIYENIDWKKEYLSTTFNVNVETTIRHTTLIDPNAKIPN